MLTPFWRKKNAQLKARLDSVVATSERIRRSSRPRSSRVEIDTTYLDRYESQVADDLSEDADAFAAEGTHPSSPEHGAYHDEAPLASAEHDAGQAATDARTPAETDAELSFEELQQVALLLEADAHNERTARLVAEQRIETLDAEVTRLGESVQALEGKLAEAEARSNAPEPDPARSRESAELAERLARAEALAADERNLRLATEKTLTAKDEEIQRLAASNEAFKASLLAAEADTAKRAAKRTAEAKAATARRQEIDALTERLSQADTDLQSERQARSKLEASLAEAAEKHRQREHDAENRLAGASADNARLRDELAEMLRETEHAAQQLIQALSAKNELDTRLQAARSETATHVARIEALEVAKRADLEALTAARSDLARNAQELASFKAASGAHERAATEIQQALGAAQRAEAELREQLAEVCRERDDAMLAHGRHTDHARVHSDGLERELDRLSRALADRDREIEETRTRQRESSADHELALREMGDRLAAVDAERHARSNDHAETLCERQAAEARARLQAEADAARIAALEADLARLDRTLAERDRQLEDLQAGQRDASDRIASVAASEAAARRDGDAVRGQAERLQMELASKVREMRALEERVSLAEAARSAAEHDAASAARAVADGVANSPSKPDRVESQVVAAPSETATVLAIAPPLSAPTQAGSPPPEPQPSPDADLAAQREKVAAAAPGKKSSESRRAPRTPSRLLAKLIGQGTGPGLTCVISDRSSSGAKLEMARDRYSTGHGDLSIGDRVTLVYQVAREQTSILCEVVWVRDVACGVRFIGQFRVETVAAKRPSPSPEAGGAAGAAQAKTTKGRLAKALFSR